MPRAAAEDTSRPYKPGTALRLNEVDEAVGLWRHQFIAWHGAIGGHTSGIGLCRFFTSFFRHFFPGMMRLNAYEAFLTSIRCIGIGAATFRPTGPRPKKHGGVIGQKGGHVTVTSPVQMKIHWKSWHITEIGMTPPWDTFGGAGQRTRG